MVYVEEMEFQKETVIVSVINMIVILHAVVMLFQIDVDYVVLLNLVNGMQIIKIDNANVIVKVIIMIVLELVVVTADLIHVVYAVVLILNI